MITYRIYYLTQNGTQGSAEGGTKTGTCTFCFLSQLLASTPLYHIILQAKGTGGTGIQAPPAMGWGGG